MARLTASLRMPEAVRQHWLASTVLAVAAALYLVAGLSVVLGDGAPRMDGSHAQAAVPVYSRLPGEAPPRPEPLELKPVSPDDALAWNASIPVSDLANPAARPFILAAASDADRTRSLDCLTAAIYYEAAVEPLEGQRAVAQVVLNRVRHPAYPTTVCGVVFEGWQRSTGCQFTFTCDGSLRRTPSAAGWAQARRVAEAALGGQVYAPVGWATHYHTNWVVPYWASSLVKAANVGTHIFYRWTGGWGRPPAFTGRHPGAEPAFAWRGGYQGPEAAEADKASERDAAAAAAARAESPHSVDSFQRAVLRRYEPLQRESATAVVNERLRAEPPVTRSQRWALTGDPGSTAQAPLGRPAAEQAPAAEAAEGQPTR